mgnify:FL=1
MIQTKLNKCKTCGEFYKKYSSLDKYCTSCKLKRTNTKYPSIWPAKVIDEDSILKKSRATIFNEHQEKRGYVICWYCGCSGFYFQLHHIIYRSEQPKHKNLHNVKNLIFLCEQCHKDIHQKHQEHRAHRIIERRLWLLFSQVKMDHFISIDKYLDENSFKYKAFKCKQLLAREKI